MEDNYLDSLIAQQSEVDSIGHLDSRVGIWLTQAYGEFKLAEIIKDLHIKTSDNIDELKSILQRCCVEGKVKEHGRKNGVYVKLDISLNKMKRVENRQPPMDLWWPLELHEKVVVNRGSLVVIAGVTNAGKSAFFLNFAEKNKDKHKIRYVSSEWSNEERDEHLEDFGVDIDEWDDKIDFYAKKDVTSSFDNYVDPQNITIIDYFESYDDYAGISGALRDIADKLTTGIAIVALQKKAGMTHGYGGEGTGNRAQLYINIDKNELDPRKRICTIRKLKKPTVRKYSIEHLSCEFEYDDKGRITGQTGWGRIMEVKQKGQLVEKYVQAESWANQKPKDNFEWE